MLLLLLSLLSHDLIIASEDTKDQWLKRLPFNHEVMDSKPAKFNDSLLIKEFRKNFIKVKTFIEDAKQQFNKERVTLTGDFHKLEETTKNRTFQYHNKTFSLRGTALAAEKKLNTVKTPIVFSKKSKPVFPFGITPHTTEKNVQHLKWDKIFPDPTSKTVYRFRKDPVILRTPSTLVTIKPGLKDQNFSGPMLRTLIQMCTKPVHPNITSKPNLLRMGTELGSTRSGSEAAETPNDEVMKIWLKSVTTGTPIEKWMETLKSESGITPRYDDIEKIPANTYNIKAYSYEKVKYYEYIQGVRDSPPQTDRVISVYRTKLTAHSTPVTRLDFILRTPARKYQSDSKDRSISLPKTTEEDFGDSANKREQLAEDAGSLNFRTDVEKNEDIRTIEDSDKSEYISNVAEQDLETQKDYSNHNRRSHHQRKRKHHSHKRNRKRQKYRHPKYSNHKKAQQEVEHLVKRMKKTIEDTKKNYSKLLKRNFRTVKQKKDIFLPNELTRSIENTKQTYPGVSPKLNKQFHINVIEKDKSIKRRDDRYKTDKKSKNKASLYEQMKELLKAAHSKKKEKQLKHKAELLRKIREDSNYIDEETSLRKNLVQALRSRRKENNEIKRLYRK